MESALLRRTVGTVGLMDQAIPSSRDRPVDLTTDAWQISGEYERLTQWIVASVAAVSAVTTLRIERHVQLAGRATNKWVDVFWEFRTGDGVIHRMLFECRSYSRRLTQDALHAWRSVVDDLATEDVEYTGVVVTRTGYQAGARHVADTYGLIILELRPPTEADLANRVLEINLTLKFRMPVIKDVTFEVVDRLDVDGPLDTKSTFIEIGASETRRLEDVLLFGELAAWDEPPRALHDIERNFAPHAKVIVGNAVVGTVATIRAAVGEFEAVPDQVRIGGREILAAFVRNALDGRCAWFAVDGHHWVTAR
jgi:hypothetical protein